MLRRLILACYTPRPNGTRLRPPFCEGAWGPAGVLSPGEDRLAGRAPHPDGGATRRMRGDALMGDGFAVRIDAQPGSALCNLPA